MANVSDDSLAAYHNLVSENAYRLRGRSQAEYDDLYQEGIIAAWTALSEGREPTLEDDIAPAQMAWVRKLRRQTGR